MHQPLLHPIFAGIVGIVAPPCDPNVTAPEAPRLAGQNGKILDRLRQGTATNLELANISLRYTSRISDLRAAGYDVVIDSRDHKTGITVYRLR